MSITWISSPASRRDPLGTLCRLAGRMLLSVARWREERRAIAALRSMSDHQLKDIGLNRTEIVHAVLTGRPGRA